MFISKSNSVKVWTLAFVSPAFWLNITTWSCNLLPSEVEGISCSVCTVATSVLNASISCSVVASCVPWVVFNWSFVYICSVWRFSASNVCLWLVIISLLSRIIIVSLSLAWLAWACWWKVLWALLNTNLSWLNAYWLRLRAFSNRFGNETILNRFGRETISNRFGNETILNRFGRETISNRFGNETISNRFGTARILTNV